jgi:hypothetical protein
MPRDPPLRARSFTLNGILVENRVIAKKFSFNKNRVDRVYEIRYLGISQGNTVSHIMR